MTGFIEMSFDNIIMAAIVCIALREVMLVTLPDAIAGPGGWLIDTNPE